MKYGFIRLKNDYGSVLYMETREFERYSSYDVFRNNADALVVFDKVYIGAFPLIFKEDEIIEFNPDATITNELPITDIAFFRSSVSSVAKSLGCMN